MAGHVVKNDSPVYSEPPRLNYLPIDRLEHQAVKFFFADSQDMVDSTFDFESETRADWRSPPAG